MKEKFKFRVSGYCYVPCRATILVESTDAIAAIRKAKREFKEHPKWHVDLGTADEAAAFEWSPSAERIDQP